MNQIERTSPVPLYSQLKNILLEKIERREWKQGELIPGETALEEMYGISRITVRQALAELVNEGYLHRQRGRGTFVTKPKFTHDPARRLALTDTMLQQGVKPGWRLLETGWLEAPDEVSKKLSLPLASKVYSTHRLRLADDDAIGYHVSYIPKRFAGAILHAALEEGGSLNYLQEVAEMESSKAYRVLEALPAEPVVAGQLKMDAGAPVLHIERVTVAADGTPIEFLSASYRGDRFKYYISI